MAGDRDGPPDDIGRLQRHEGGSGERGSRASPEIVNLLGIHLREVQEDGARPSDEDLPLKPVFAFSRDHAMIG